ncbi:MULTISPECIES: GNAT family N-acetyltransferase [Streptacidiphilus]|uniref:GNAT family N-acetyltransferase n=1 Tax=Streptacidiphilus cavernicola TaxID=3342716 RepID=A0ABV6UJV7_9ACTN|nr:GNAT family N-acetyltransferase [Streptacidiphilus jeojiense]
MAEVVLRTERLVLRGWRDEDLEMLVELDSDPEVMRYVGDGKVKSREEAAAWFDRIRAAWAELGYGLFAVELAESGELTGWVGLAVPRFLPEIMPAVEIGWRLLPRHWGRGIATEAAREALRFAFEEAELDRVVSICHVDNEPSRRVMEKLGLRQDRLTTVPAHDKPVRVLAITREEYAVTRKS